ncbi:MULTISPECIES: glutathione S-transferase family protein [Streptomyces]|uniref:Uncharacterized protein n=1 Tax=Streptomyces edwardsiae TaxID=3075527 RepID=A0ABU2QIB6_9ACTN|nr:MULTISPECIES: hypothetical protein [unclassified Streptomyces]MDT0404203.1 hypothetical protein [Streptomyces sp. DSM 41635]
MPTPYGSRGGLAFGVEELRVLRRALVLALDPAPAPASADDLQDCLRLAEDLDEATRESGRLRAFLLADLGRYRAALPGTAAGYLTLLEEALGAGYRPRPDDLAALRALRGNPTAAALLHLSRRTLLLALPGGRAAAEKDREEEKDPAQQPPATPRPQPGPAPKPPRPVPTPGEVFPRRKPAPPAPDHHLAAG